MRRYITASDIALIIVFSVKWTDFFRYHFSLNQPVFSPYTAHAVPNRHPNNNTCIYRLLQMHTIHFLIFFCINANSR